MEIFVDTSELQSNRDENPKDAISQPKHEIDDDSNRCVNINHPILSNKTQSLIELGFAHDEVIDALDIFSNDIEKAANYLLTNEDSRTTEESMRAKRLRLINDQFFQGSVSMTYNISLPELIDKHNLKQCIISAFCFDFEWALSLLPKGIPKCFIIHDKTTKESRVVHDKIKLTTIIPALSGWGTMVYIF